MKKSIAVWLAGALMIVFTACTDAPGFMDAVLFTGTETSPVTTLILDGPSSMALTVTATEKVDHDIRVQLKVAPEKLEQYNSQSGKKYVLPPENSFSLSSQDVTIKANEYISEGTQLSVKSVDQLKEGVTYCIPITIESVEGGLSILNASRTIYVELKRIITTKAAVLEPNYFTVESFKTSPDVSALQQVTMECRVLVNRFEDNNPYISSVIGIEENFLLRFGDVSVEKNQLQMAGGAVSGTKYPVTGKTFFSTQKWYHIAVVYDGKTMALYVNGKLDGYTNANQGTVNLNDTYLGGFHMGYSERGRLLDGFISEARLWKRALTANELIDNICYIDPASKDLIAYWRFNGTDENGNIPDLSGHGHVATPAQPVRWVEGVKCP